MPVEKYKRIRYKGIVCDRCGVEVTEKKVRRERIGHISLVVPVAHIWYFRSLPNKLGYLLGIPTKKLDMIIYYERYIVIQTGEAVDNEGNAFEHMQFLTEEEYLDALDRLPMENQYLDDSDPNKFIAKMGAEALLMLLQRLDLDAMSYDLRDRASRETSQQRKRKPSSVCKWWKPARCQRSLGKQARVDGHQGSSRHPARIAPLGALGRWSLRYV